MKTPQKGFIGLPLLALIAVLLIGGGAYVYVQNTQTTNASITVLSPNGGEVYKAGSPMTIRWKATGLSSNAINIILSRVEETQTIPIATNTQNTGSYTWTIPQNLGTGSFMVRVSTPNANGEDNIENKNADYSDAFTINSAVATSTAQTITEKSTTTATFTGYYAQEQVREIYDGEDFGVKNCDKFIAYKSNNPLFQFLSNWSPGTVDTNGNLSLNITLSNVSSDVKDKILMSTKEQPILLTIQKRVFPGKGLPVCGTVVDIISVK